MQELTSCFLKGAAKTSGGLVALSVGYSIYVLFSSVFEKFTTKKDLKDLKESKVVDENGEICIVDKKEELQIDVDASKYKKLF